MKIDDITRQSLMYDFYGELLTKRQRDVMTFYYEENLTLSEIAEEFSISRQGVHDALKSAEKSLINYEEKLGLVEKFMKSSRVIAKIDDMIDEITEKLCDEEKSSSQMIDETICKLNKNKSIIDKLED